PAPLAVVTADVPVEARPDPQVLRYVVSTPRAVRLRYQVDCPSVRREGTLGETYEQYRARRLAELGRERDAAAGMLGALVGAVAPPVRAGAAVAGPGGSATVAGEIDPGRATAAAAR